MNWRTLIGVVASELFLCAALLAALSYAAGARAGPSAPAGATFTVNSTADQPDFAPGDGVCEDGPGNHVCTLRAAVMEANALAGPDTIILPAGTYVLSRFGIDNTSLNGDLDISTTLTISGAGALQTIIDGDGSVLKDRVVSISASGNAYILGVTIQHGGDGTTGGGILNAGRLTVADSLIQLNSASPITGVGIFNSGFLTLTGSRVEANLGGSSYGSGVYNGGTAIIVASVISGNIGIGGIYNDISKTLTMTASIVSFNYNSGGIYNLRGTVEIHSSSIYSNSSSGSGGGIHNRGGYANLVNSTISGNIATLGGGGIMNTTDGLNGGTISLFNVTITQNRADYNPSGSTGGGGIANVDRTVNFQNSIISTNFDDSNTSNAPNCAGTLNSLDYNLIRDVSGCTIVGATSHIITGTFPLLGPLQYNGGATPTHALRPSSPAIDAGNPGGCADDGAGATLRVDQRGFPRPADGDHDGSAICDLGAYEFEQELFLPLIGR